MRNFLHVDVKLSKAYSWNLSESTLVYKLIGDNSLHSSARTSEHRHSNELTSLVVYRILFFYWCRQPSQRKGPESENGEWQ